MRSSSHQLSAVAAVLLACPWALAVETIAPTYPIREPDLLEQMERTAAAKAASGEALRQQQAHANRIAHALRHPAPLATVSRATSNRTAYHDPTLVVEQDIRDEQGRILVPVGTTINPLDKVALSRPLVFFDSRDPAQTAFAKRFLDKREGMARPVLVGGSYFDLMKRWQTPVYFDQRGALVRTFGIRHVPAIVAQEGRRLRIDEIALQ